jgi:HD domain
VNVRPSPVTFGSMTHSDWAEDIARILLAESLPRRWAHVQGVAAVARDLAPILGDHAEVLTAAALLHDIGYAPSVEATGFHPLDGARYLRDVQHADDLLCRLVAHHSCALIEAEQWGLAADLSREFTPPPRDLSDALIYCDMTTGPDGQRMTVEQRLADIRGRYGPEHPVTRALGWSAPQLTAAVERVTGSLTACIVPPRRASLRPRRLVPVLAG